MWFFPMPSTPTTCASAPADTSSIARISPVIAAFDRLAREGEYAPRMMSVGLHLRIIGRPARIGGLEMLLSGLAERGTAWTAPRAAIAAHWRTALGLPSWEPKINPA